MSDMVLTGSTVAPDGEERTDRLNGVHNLDSMGCFACSPRLDRLGVCCVDHVIDMFPPKTECTILRGTLPMHSRPPRLDAWGSSRRHPSDKRLWWAMPLPQEYPSTPGQTASCNFPTPQPT